MEKCTTIIGYYEHIYNRKLTDWEKKLIGDSFQKQIFKILLLLGF
jgi:hypothetical protein